MAKNKASINANSPRRKSSIKLRKANIRTPPCKNCSGKKLKP